EHPGERQSLQPVPEPARVALAALGQWNVREPGVLPGEGPGGLTVPRQVHDGKRRAHTTHPATLTDDHRAMRCTTPRLRKGRAVANHSAANRTTTSVRGEGAVLSNDRLPTPWHTGPGSDSPDPGVCRGR